MVEGLQQYELVRIRQLLQPAADYDGWHVNQRPPQVSDVGTLLDILHAPGLPDRYVVESCDADGVTAWLGDFAAEELEPLGQYRNAEQGAPPGSAAYTAFQDSKSHLPPHG